MSTQTYASKRHAAQTYTAGNAGTARIDLQNGSIYHTFSDIRCPNGKMPLGISHIYTGDDNFRFATFGKGWHLSICPTFFVAPQIEETVGTYTDSEGYVHPFLGAIGDPVILRDCDGLGLVYQEGYFPIEEGSEETVFLRCLIDQKGNRIEFDYRGRMIRGVDTSGNQITVAYDATYNRPVTVTDAAGRVATLAYGEDGRLASITDPKGLAVRYTYDEGGHLLSATYTESVRRFDFTYDSQSRLTSAADDKGKMLRFAYDANARVSKVETVMFRVAYGAIGASTSTIDEVKARDTFAYYGDAAVITALSGMRRIVRMDDLGYPTLTYTEQGTSGVEVDENAFVYKEYAHHEARPYVAFEASGIPCTYDTGASATASLDILADGGRLDNCSLGDLWFGDFYDYGMTEGTDGIVAASPMGESKCYRIMATPNGEKTLEFSKNVEYESFPHRAFAFAVRACVEGVDLYPVGDEEIIEIELKLGCNGIPALKKTVPLIRGMGGAQTVVACMSLPTGAHLAYIYATVRCKNTSHHLYLKDLRLLPVPYRTTSYVDALEGETVTAKTMDENGTVTESAIPFLYKTVIDDEKYVTTSWYAEGEDPIRREVKDLAGNVFTAYATYDDKHRLVRSEDIRGRATEYTYSEKGQVTQEKTYHKDTPSTCYITDKTYTDEGYLASVSMPKSGAQKTVYTYTPGGDVASETDPRGATTDYTYSEQYGYLTWVRGEEVNGEEPWCSYSYSWDEHIGNSTDSAFFGFTFDGLGRRKGDVVNSTFWANYSYDDTPAAPTATVEYANGQKIAVTKNAAGKPISRTFTPAGSEEPTAMLTCTYDSAGRLQKKVDNLAETEYNYKYNAKGELIGVYTNNSSVYEQYTYDAYNRLLTRKNTWTGTAERFTYETDADGNTYPDAGVKQMLVTAGKFAGMKEILTRDALGRLTESNLQHNASSRYVKRTYTYTSGTDRKTDMPSAVQIRSFGGYNEKFMCGYDANGNIAGDGSPTYGMNSYTYDALNRLTSATCTETGITYYYAYDKCGNILSKRTVSADADNTVTYTYNTDPEGYGDQMLSYNGQRCVYDACGNPTTYRGKTVLWSLGRRMTRYGTNTFAYNGDGQRIQKNSTYYGLWNGRLLWEQNTRGTIYYLYNSNDEVVGMNFGNAIYYYVKNIQGDVVALLDANGRLLGRYIYDPWGKIVKTVDANGNVISPAASTNILNINPIRYRSYYYDTETGLYYLQTRYYDPETGRFLNADAFKYLGADGPIHGMNLYAYCGNNPVGCSDPSGTFAIALTALCIWKAIKIALVVTGAIAGACILAGAAYAGCSALVATTDESRLNSVSDVQLDGGKDGKYLFDYAGETFTATYAGGSWQIQDSYKIRNENDLRIICAALSNRGPVESKVHGGYRSPESLAFEWQQHNIVYYWAAPFAGTSLADAAIESTWAVDLDPSVDEGKNAIQLSWDRAKKMLGLE